MAERKFELWEYQELKVTAAIYIMQRKKLQTKDGGTEDDYAKWFNGETPNGEVPESLNGFDSLIHFTDQQ